MPGATDIFSGDIFRPNQGNQAGAPLEFRFEFVDNLALDITLLRICIKCPFSSYAIYSPAPINIPRTCVPEFYFQIINLHISHNPLVGDVPHAFLGEINIEYYCAYGRCAAL
jgi:hypothetical protein